MVIGAFFEPIVFTGSGRACVAAAFARGAGEFFVAAGFVSASALWSTDASGANSAFGGSIAGADKAGAAAATFVTGCGSETPGNTVRATRIPAAASPRTIKPGNNSFRSVNATSQDICEPSVIVARLYGVEAALKADICVLQIDTSSHSLSDRHLNRGATPRSG